MLCLCLGRFYFVYLIIYLFIWVRLFSLFNFNSNYARSYRHTYEYKTKQLFEEKKNKRDLLSTNWIRVEKETKTSWLYVYVLCLLVPTTKTHSIIIHSWFWHPIEGLFKLFSLSLSLSLVHSLNPVVSMVLLTLFHLKQTYFLIQYPKWYFNCNAFFLVCAFQLIYSFYSNQHTSPMILINGLTKLNIKKWK